MDAQREVDKHEQELEDERVRIQRFYDFCVLVMQFFGLLFVVLLVVPSILVVEKKIGAVNAAVALFVAHAVEKLLRIFVVFRLSFLAALKLIVKLRQIVEKLAFL